MQSIIKTFLILALIGALVAAGFDLTAIDNSSSYSEKDLNIFYHFAQGLFMLSGVLVICATALLYKYGWGKAKHHDAGN